MGTTTTAYPTEYSYAVVRQPATSYGSAESFCREKFYGGWVTIIHTANHNGYMRELAREAGVSKYFIGFKRFGPGNLDEKFGTGGTSTSPNFLSAGRSMTSFDLPDLNSDGVNDLWARKEPNYYKKNENFVISAPNGWNDVREVQAKGKIDGVACTYIATTTTMAPTTTTTGEPTSTTTGEPTSTTT